VLGENGPDHLNAAPIRIPGELVLERVQVEGLHDLRLVEGALDLSSRKHVRDVELGPRDRGARDVLLAGGVGGRERFRAVHVDTGKFAARAARHGHVDPHPAKGSQSQQCRGRAVREHSAGPTRENRGHPPTFARQQLGRDERVDPGVKAMQTASGGAPPDPPRGQTELAQLVELEHRMMIARQRRQGGIERSLGVWRDCESR
jgi:hypothetical protein